MFFRNLTALNMVVELTIYSIGFPLRYITSIMTE
jgi:hypothetical protein